MILQTVSNKSICVIGNLINEHDIVSAFRQFRVDEIVKNFGSMWRITTHDTYVDSSTHLCHNWYTLVAVQDENLKRNEAELMLLQENPRNAPENIFDAIAHVLPMPLFTHGDWNSGLGVFIRGVSN